MRWTGHVACMMEGALRVLVGRPEKKYLLKYLGVDVMAILNVMY
jgi:hypothetical protein